MVSGPPLSPQAPLEERGAELGLGDEGAAAVPGERLQTHELSVNAGDGERPGWAGRIQLSHQVSATSAQAWQQRTSAEPLALEIPSTVRIHAASSRRPCRRLRRNEMRATTART